ncbi:MAG: hypothetical protein IJ775_01905 [Muribaculaceae bacterium]|nr:hypothetical protein [Muribaculaceae bacterium]
MNYTHISTAEKSGKLAARQSRDREFLEIYNQALELFIKQGVPNPKRLAVRWAISHGAPHYHVSYERAYKVINHILHKGHNPLLPSLQACMWQEIAERVRELTESAGMSVARAVEFVLAHCRASRFFVTEHYAYATLVDRARKERSPRRV